MFDPSHLQAFLASRPRYQRHWVGLSGGLDSVVLLHAVASLRLPQPLLAVHVHHGLSPFADDWQRRCEQLCQSLEVPLHVQKVAVNAVGEGVEAAARRARYRAFEQVLAEDDALLLAHHQDDQAETVLYRLLRTSGPRGLAGMAAERELGKAQLLRPLLNVSRADLEAYAQQWGLSWVEDESNSDTGFDRNYLRHRVMPVLAERWPEAAAQMAASAALCRDTENLLVELANDDLSALAANVVPLGGSLDLAGLAALSPSRRHNLLRHWIRQLGLPSPGGVHLQEITQQFFASDEAPHGRQVSWPGCRACSFDGRFYVLDERAFWEPTEETPKVSWQDPAHPLALPGGDSLRWQLVASGGGLAPRWLSGLEVRWRQGGERFHPNTRQHSQSLKKLLQENHVPPWLRGRLPLLYAGDQLVAVADLWVAKGFEAAPDEPGHRCVWQLAPAD